MARNRLFPTFWTVLFTVGLALNLLALAANHPERLQGWRGAGLAALLLVILGAYQWYTSGRIYRDQAISARSGLAALAAQLLALLPLVRWYDATFGWVGLALIFEVVSGLPRRGWPLPLAGVLLVLALGALPPEGGALEAGSVAVSLFLFVISLGIAVFIRLLNDQRDQLREALAQLERAHAALAESAVQQKGLAVLRERARLARALHDHLGRALVVMNVKLEAAQLLYARDAPAANHAAGDAELEATRLVIRETMAELRRALAGLRATTGPRDDLPAALRQMAGEVQARSGIALTVAIPPGLPSPPARASEALWYVGREALSNVERHAAAASATLTLCRDGDGWRLRIEDDGQGVAASDLGGPEHYGLLGMRERMQAVGGTLRVERGSAGGAVVEACLPAPDRPEARPA
jgi:signal transduction histidine kinase